VRVLTASNWSRISIDSRIILKWIFKLIGCGDVGCIHLSQNKHYGRIILKWIFKVMGCEGVDCIQLAQDKHRLEDNIKMGL
jgi:hypothetical protein